MHAGMRRVPVERARHAKRLGHAFPVFAGPIQVTSATQQVTTTIRASLPSAVPATNSLSSALTSSSTTRSSSSPPSSATTPPTSSVATSINTQPPATSEPPTPLITSTAVLTSTPPTLSPTSTPQTNATHSSLSGGAIAGIIAGAAIFGAALIVYFVRKTYLRRRERKRISWSGAPGLGTGINDDPKPFPGTSDRRASFTSVACAPQRTVPPSPFAAHGQSMHSTPVAYMQHPTIPTHPVPLPPSATYNNPAPVAAYSVPAPYGPGNPPHVMTPGAAGAGIPSTLPFAGASRAPMEATVKCTFVPNLPDELSITTGERIFIVEQYDDGWDLCANVRGERGMVPRECLEHIRIDQPDVTWRNGGRTSSLNPDGQRY